MSLFGSSEVCDISRIGLTSQNTVDGGRPTEGPLALSAIVLVLSVYFSLLAVLPKRAVWVCDEGLKMVSAQWIARTGRATALLPYPARELDAEYRFFPFPSPADRSAALVVHTQRGPSSVFPIALPFFSAPLFRSFGWLGLYLVPMASAALALFLMYGLWRVVGGTPLEAASATVFLGLLSPLWFYAVTFWEHAPAVALAALSLFLAAQALTRKALWLAVLAGGAASLGMWFREEIYVWVVAIALGLGVSTKRPSLSLGVLLGALFGAVPLWQYNVANGQGLLGVHAAANLPHSFSPNLLSFYYLFLCMAQAVPLSLILSLPSVLAVLLALVRHHSVTENTFASLGIAGAIGVALSLGGFFYSHGDLVTLIFLNSLSMFVAFPIFASYWIAGDTGESRAMPRRFLVVTLASYLGLCAFLPSYSAVRGIHHGPRVLLPAFLILSGAAASGMFRLLRSPQRSGRALRTLAVASTLAATLAVQIHFGRMLVMKKQLSAQLCAKIEATGEPYVLTSLWWAAQELAPVYFRKRIMYSRSPLDEMALLDRLEERGVKRLRFLGGKADPHGPLRFMDVWLSPSLSITERRSQLASVIWPKATP